MESRRQQVADSLTSSTAANWLVSAMSRAFEWKQMTPRIDVASRKKSDVTSVWRNYSKKLSTAALRTLRLR
ncbi:hypothetical protein GQ600_16379 [Phytophthora cactorum]|nr:hypothetical protein GQ600_16379 [Phytophthora cactorum]